MTLVLLHPLPLDSSIWPEELTGRVDGCIAPNLYSLGRDIRDWAKAVLDLAGRGRLTLVGNSVGGSCAIEVALLAPDKVDALVLSGTKAGHDPEPDFRDEVLQLLDEAGIEEAWDRYWRPLFGPDVPDDTIRLARGIAVGQGASAIATGVSVFHSRPDRDSFLDEWQGPVWVVSGAHDIHPARARDSAARLARGQFREVQGAGHYVPLEAPEEFCGIVAEATQAAGY